MKFTNNQISRWDRVCTKHVSPLTDRLKGVLDDLGLCDLKILDVGSNTGKFIELLQKDYNVTEALLIEPVSCFLEYTQKKFSSFDYKYENIGLGDRREKVYFQAPAISSDTMLNLGLGKVTDNAFCEDTINVDRFDDVWTKKYSGFVPNVIKIDAEGYDLKAIEGMEQFITRTDSVQIIIYEYTGHNKSLADKLKEFDSIKYLIKLGFAPIWTELFLPDISCDVCLIRK